MKRILTLFLCAVLLVGSLPMTAFAETGGDGNIDGGGSGMGSGTSENYWNPGMDGVRVTVIKADTQQPVTTPIDLTNKKPTVSAHFGKVSKISYRNGISLSPSTSSYTYYNPAIKMPTIISTDGNVNIDAIKSYFCDEIIVRYIAQCTSMNYDTLISGKYKLLLEPISYFVHNSVRYAFTAHEIALYDNQTSGALWKTMTSLTHKNQRFTEQVPDVPQTNYDYEYRINTDVITSVTLYASGEINPKAPASVTFRINGSSYKVNNIVIPEGESQLVWVKWHTPSAPTNITITVSTTKGVLSQTSIGARVVELAKNDPPDPKATDTKGSWSAASVPNRNAKTSASWSVWSAAWHANWIWHENWQ